MTVQRTFLAAAAACAVTAAAVAGAAQRPTAAPYEVWIVDQSDTRGLNHGGTLYIFAGRDLAGRGSASPAPAAVVDLGGAAAALCREQTGANPVRPHMLLFNQAHTHAVLAFVASGHVAVFDAAGRRPLACVRTTESPTGRQAHAAFPSPDGSYILIANQNGKRLERIDANFSANSFAHNPAATLDLAACRTPSGMPCQTAAIVGSIALNGALTTNAAPDLADGAPDGTLAFVALRGPTPLSGDPHNATGATPGLGVLQVTDGGRNGRLVRIVRLTNLGADGVERADPHAVRVRRVS